MEDTKVRVITDEKEFIALESTWNKLLQTCGENNSIYLTYEWVGIWWRYFGEGQKLNILLIEQKGKLIGIIPLMKIRYGLPFFGLTALETIGGVNCNMVGIIPLSYMNDAIDAFLAYLREEVFSEGIYLRLVMVPDNSSFFKKLQSRLSVLFQDVFIEAKTLTLAPYITLPPTWNEYYSSLGRRRRKILRRAQNMLEKEHDMKVREYDRDSLEEGLSNFMDLHQRRWQAMQIRGIFSDPKMKLLYRDISARFYDNDWLYFTCMEVDGRVVSIYFNFVYNNKMYCATAARDVGFSGYSVGHVHILFITKEAINRNLYEIDLLRGDEPYKFYWTKTSRKYMQIIASRRRFYSELSFKLLRLFFRIHNLSHYNLKEIFSLYLMKRKEAKQKEEMLRKGSPNSS
jgi:CelD/BcsL family acetyltransferase involved in cellulose biosynthesis